jgi:hypothetical protein
MLAGVAGAQERLPLENAQRFAKLFVEQAAKLTDAQVKTDVDAEKPCCITKGEPGAMIIPDKNLSADALAKAGKDVTPLGQLWMRKLTPVVDGKPVPGDKLRIVTVTVKNADEPMVLCLAGVRKKGDGLELVLYAKDKEPLLTVPLEKVETKQELPVELDGKKGDNDTGVLILSVLGKYQAKVPFGHQE